MCPDLMGTWYKDDGSMGSAHDELGSDTSTSSSLASPERSAAQLAVPRVDTPRRDRIVILGRRRSGKTVFLARLYSELWKQTRGLHMRAVSGDTHKACMQVIEELANGRWPASTLGSQYADIEITYKDEKHLLVSLDYPGEVFRKAFVDNADSEDARELIAHVDRAAAVLVLLDPSVVESGSVMEVIDDDYGMVQAIHRIREWPGGDCVPITLIMTKHDQHRELIKSYGGLRSFVMLKYPALCRAVRQVNVFSVAAVSAKVGPDRVPVPSLHQPPIRLVEPLQHCLDQLRRRGKAEAAEAAARERRVARAEVIEAEVHARKRSILFWSLFWVGAVLVFGVTGLVLWMALGSGA